LNSDTDYCRIQKRNRRKPLCVNFCLVPIGATYNALKAEARAHVREAQAVFKENVKRCCPDIRIRACYAKLEYWKYLDIAALGEAGGLETVQHEDEKSTDKSKNRSKVSDELKNLLKYGRKENCVTVYIFPKLESRHTSWNEIVAITISPNDFPETVSASGSGPSIIMRQGQPPSSKTFIHELGHLLIDLPRSFRNGIEHVNDPERVMHLVRIVGNKFTKRECERIWQNIDLYNGSCKC